MTLVSYFPLSESGPFLDRVRNKVAGNYSLGTGFSGPLGTSAVKSGLGTYAMVEDNLVYSGSRSVSVWFYPTADETWYINNSLSTSALFDFEEAEANKGSFMLCPRNNEISDHIGLHFWAYNCDSGVLLSDIGINQWHHFVGVHDANLNQQRIYINGALEGTSSYTLSLPSTGKFQIARRHEGTKSREVKGKLAEMRIYNHALSPSEVQYLSEIPEKGHAVTGRKVA